MKRSSIAMGLILTVGIAAGGETNCDEAAGQYLRIAHERDSAGEHEQAAVLARRALDVCRSYEGYELLAESLAHSLGHDDQTAAVDAFVSAHELASTDQQRARALFRYAYLLNQNNDVQNAYLLIHQAEALDPASEEITRFAHRVDHRYEHPTVSDLRGGLYDSLYKPLRMAAAPVPEVAGGGRETGSSANSAEPKIAAGAAPSISIPIHFETGTTIVDAQTRANIAVLAAALADPAHPDQHYVFVGHADVRGNEASNVVLTQRRAEAMYQLVVQAQPSLQGRVEVTGRGSSEPIDPGHDERAYRANRRLQVLVK